MPFSIFRERTYHGDFIEGCFGVLGPLGNYPQGTFLGHISVENNPKIDHCVQHAVIAHDHGGE